MISITRDLARRLRSVLRKSGAGKNCRPVIEFKAVAGDLCIRAQLPNIIVEYAQPSADADSLLVPFDFLEDAEAKSDAFVTLAKNSEGVEASWEDGLIPKRKSYAVAESAASPTVPDVDWAQGSIMPGFLEALGHASECVAENHPRYATGNIQLHGSQHEIVATDGRQALIQGGFVLPWQDAVLIPSLALYGCRELTRDQAPKIAKTETHVAIQLGEWTFYVVIDKTGRFPNVAAAIPQCNAKSTVLRLGVQDMEFLGKALGKLPGGHEDCAPITLDLNGQVALRAKEPGQDRPTEIVLATSQVSGTAVRVNTDRRFLARAIALGFDTITVVGADMPVVCKNLSRTYVWVPLAKAGAIPPSDNAIRITTQENANTPQAIKERMNPPMPTAHPNGRANGEQDSDVHAATNGNGQAGATEHAENATGTAGTSLGALISEAHALRDFLHDGYARASKLCVSLKRHRKQSKLVATTLASLRQLQQIEG